MGLRILHTADWHLDSPFASFSRMQRETLQQEQRRIPELVMQLCQRERCDLMLLAGDIFDGPYTKETVRILREALENCGIPVFVAPGNHDFYAPGSPWMEESWPENVCIFTGGLQYADLPELDCRVYGGGYRSMDCLPLLEDFRAEGDMRYKVAVLHGDATQPRSPYCPITVQQVRSSGLDYLALGHIHKAGGFQADKTLCAWPGCPMGRGWDETGEKGLCIVDLDTGAQIRTVSLNTLRFVEKTVDITEHGVDALEDVLPPVVSSDFYRITLTGIGSVELSQLYKRFAHIPNLSLRDRTEEPAALWEDADQDSLRGVYFRMLRDAEQSASPWEAKRIRLAAEISRKLLEGKEVELP